jgi:hypothetical protein
MRVVYRQASTNASAIACSSVIAHPSAQADAKASSPGAHGGDVALVCLAMDWRKEDTHGFADRCRCAEQVCRADRLALGDVTGDALQTFRDALHKGRIPSR